MSNNNTLEVKDNGTQSKKYVPVEIEIIINVSVDHFTYIIKEELLTILSNQILPDGRKAFFHPHNFSLGQSLHLNMLYKAIMLVDGINSIEITKFHRLDNDPNNELEQGYISIGRIEVIRLDNDPDHPENGVLRLKMEGGK